MGDESPWDTCPLEGHHNDILFPRTPRGEGRGRWKWRTPPFWKLPTGAGSRAGREARRNIRACRAPSRSSRGLGLGGLGLGRSVCVWRFGLVLESGEFVEPAASGERAWVVRWSLQSVESPGVAKEMRTGGAALPAVSRKPARSCGESRRELACHAECPSSTAATLAAVGTGRHDSPHQGTSRVQVTCTVLWDSFGLPSSTI